MIIWCNYICYYARHTLKELIHLYVNFTVVESINFLKTLEKNDLNWTQPNLHATTENFLFFDMKPLKKHFYLENFFYRVSPLTPTSNHYKIIFYLPPLAKVLVVPLNGDAMFDYFFMYLLNVYFPPLIGTWGNQKVYNIIK